jgi:phage gp46-like protein
MTDVYLYQTNDDDGGNITLTNGVIEMNGGLETAVYLSLFGGNDDDTEWWGNIDEPDINKHQISETQKLIEALPLTSANLKRVEDAIKRDLNWMIAINAATGLEVSASIPGLNSIQIDITVIADDEEQQLTFIENWKADI